MKFWMCILVLIWCVRAPFRVVRGICSLVLCGLGLCADYARDRLVAHRKARRCELMLQRMVRVGMREMKAEGLTSRTSRTTANSK